MDMQVDLLAESVIKTYLHMFSSKMVPLILQNPIGESAHHIWPSGSDNKIFVALTIIKVAHPCSRPFQS